MKFNMNPYIRLIRADKPIGTLLLLWPTLTALWMASFGIPKLSVLFIFIAGVFLVRSAGCIINDIADQKFDKHVARTKARPLATGEISTRSAIIFAGLLLLLAFCLVLFLNIETIIMAIVAALLTAVYPFMKRYTHFPQVWLGIAFNWGILMAFTAVQTRIPLDACLFYVAVLWITVAYDTMYAMVDREDDLKIGVKSTAVFFGDYDRLVVAILQIAAFVLIFFVGRVLQLNAWFYIGFFIAALFATYQNILIVSREPGRCFKAFLNNHYLLLSLFLGVLLAFLQ